LDGEGRLLSPRQRDELNLAEAFSEVNSRGTREILRINKDKQKGKGSLDAKRKTVLETV